MGYRRNQPFNDNLLCSCPILDSPGALIRLVEESGAKSTDYQAQETAKEYSDKCEEKAENGPLVQMNSGNAPGIAKAVLSARSKEDAKENCA